MRFSKMVGCTGFQFDFRPAGFYAKKTKRDWISTHKEGRLDTFDNRVGCIFG